MDEKKILTLYREEQKSTYEIAEIYNTYPNKIRRILIRNGVQLKTKSEAQKNALDNGKSKLPTKGKKRTKEEKLKISSSLQKRWENIDKKTYDEHVKNAKKRWHSMSQRDKDNMLKAAIQAIRTAGKEGSKLEKYIREELTRSGHTVEAHKKNIIPNENLEIDMYLPKLKTIIEVDGPSHFIPIWGEDKLHKQIKADENKTGLILSKGLAIIRVKNLSDSVSLNRQESIKNRILELLNDIAEKFPSKANRYIEIEI